MGVCRAYNTWLAEACNKAPDRLKAVGVVSLQDPQGAAKEISRLRDMGVTAVMINGTTGAKRLDHPDHDVFFAEADRLKMPIAVHFSLQFPVVDKLFEHHFPNRVLAGILPIMAGLTSVLCSGLLDRYKQSQIRLSRGRHQLGAGPCRAHGRPLRKPALRGERPDQPPTKRLLEIRANFFRLRRQRIFSRPGGRRGRRRSVHVFLGLSPRRPHRRHCPFASRARRHSGNGAQKTSGRQRPPVLRPMKNIAAESPPGLKKRTTADNRTME